jgi:hypothetical protein
MDSQNIKNRYTQTTQGVYRKITDNIPMPRIEEKDESNFINSFKKENSNMASMSRIQSSLTGKNDNYNYFKPLGREDAQTSNTKQPNGYLDSAFPKIPKFTSISTMRKDSSESLGTVQKISQTNFQTPILSSNWKSNLGYTSKLTTPNLMTGKYDSLLISNFRPHEESINLILNEFKKFGRISEYNLSDSDNILFIKFENSIDVNNAYSNYNPNVLGRYTKLIVELNKSNNYQVTSRMPAKASNIKIESPSVSYINYLKDLFFNW